LGGSKNNLERTHERQNVNELQEVMNRSMDNVCPPNHKRIVTHQDDSELMRVLYDPKQLKELSYQND
jgi:hypothetical protein